MGDGNTRKTVLLWYPRVTIPNRMLNHSAVFAHRTCMTDASTDRRVDERITYHNSPHLMQSMQLQSTSAHDEFIPEGWSLVPTIGRTSPASCPTPVLASASNTKQTVSNNCFRDTVTTHRQGRQTELRAIHNYWMCCRRSKCNTAMPSNQLLQQWVKTKIAACISKVYNF